MATDIPSRRRRRKTRESGQEMASAPFEDGTDFIRFDADSDTEEVKKREERERDRNTRRKGKERERTRDTHSPRPPSASPPPLPSSSRRRDSDSRDGRGEPRENGHTREREWDRGKRKYDMVFDPSDGYQNKKQRTDAKSRLAPWVDEVDWDGCENAAEMCVYTFLTTEWT